MFTRSSFVAGLRATIPIGLSIFAYGTVFGVLAGRAGLSLAETSLMSGLVFAGSSQFAALTLWGAPLPIATIIATTFVVNLRHLLLGAAIQPYLAEVPLGRRLTAMFFLNDESWALTMGELEAGNADGAFLLGSGIVSFIAWSSASVVGRLAGSIVRDPERLGLDFAFIAVMLALLAGMWRGRSDLAPWLVAALASLVIARLVPGNWYILAGALAGSLWKAARHVEA